MPTSIDHALFGLLVFFFPLWALSFGYRRLRLADPDAVPRVRLSLYRNALVIQWTLAAFTAVMWGVLGRPWQELGLVPRPTYGLIGVIVGVVIVAFFLHRQRTKLLGDDEGIAEVRYKLRNLERMMPHTATESRWFAALSVTAGICEELLYRGYVVWYLSHWFGVIQSIGIAALIFGIGHAYQGPRGMLLTGVVGLFLGGVYLISGSLFPGMLIHAAMDMHTGSLAYAVYSRTPASPEDAPEAAADAAPDADAVPDAEAVGELPADPALPRDA